MRQVRFALSELGKLLAGRKTKILELAYIHTFSFVRRRPPPPFRLSSFFRIETHAPLAVFESLLFRTDFE